MAVTYGPIVNVTSVYDVQTVTIDPNTNDIWMVAKITGGTGNYEIIVMNSNHDITHHSTFNVSGHTYMIFDSVYSDCYISHNWMMSVSKATKNIDGSISIINFYNGNWLRLRILESQELCICDWDHHKLVVYPLSSLHNNIFTSQELTVPFVQDIIYNNHCDRYVTASFNGGGIYWFKKISGVITQIGYHEDMHSLFYLGYNSIIKKGITMSIEFIPHLIDCSADTPEIVTVTELDAISNVTENDVYPTDGDERTPLNLDTNLYGACYGLINGLTIWRRTNLRELVEGSLNGYRSISIDRNLKRAIRWANRDMGEPAKIDFFRLNNFGGDNAILEHSQEVIFPYRYTDQMKVMNISETKSRVYWSYMLVESGLNLNYIEYDLIEPEINPKATVSNILIEVT